MLIQDSHRGPAAVQDTEAATILHFACYCQMKTARVLGSLTTPKRLKITIAASVFLEFFLSDNACDP
jgi:hypothetical protein